MTLRHLRQSFPRYLTALPPHSAIPGMFQHYPNSSERTFGFLVFSVTCSDVHLELYAFIAAFFVRIRSFFHVLHSMYRWFSSWCLCLLVAPQLPHSQLLSLSDMCSCVILYVPIHFGSRHPMYGLADGGHGNAIIAYHSLVQPLPLSSCALLHQLTLILRARLSIEVCEHIMDFYHIGDGPRMVYEALRACAHLLGLGSSSRSIATYCSDVCVPQTFCTHAARYASSWGLCAPASCV